MSETHHCPDGLTTAAFESALEELVRTAKRDGVELNRSLDVSDDSGRAGWMVEITRVERRR